VEFKKHNSTSKSGEKSKAKMAAWPRMGTLILVKNEGVLLEFERGGRTLFYGCHEGIP